MKKKFKFNDRAIALYSSSTITKGEKYIIIQVEPGISNQWLTFMGMEGKYNSNFFANSKQRKEKLIRVLNG